VPVAAQGHLEALVGEGLLYEAGHAFLVLDHQHAHAERYCLWRPGQNDNSFMRPFRLRS
jgi:hypothetical protein